jgi:D-alanyl-D-alanine carboxypeptidase/D-alanyl-D-alanine-endopeptidase (penicillin-binding protein 4)
MKSSKSGRKVRSLLLTCALSLSIILVFTAERLPARLSQESAPAQANSSEASSRAQTSRSAQELARRIEEAINGSDFKLARWGIFVVSLRDGRTLYAREADRPFAPASNMKAYTTALALDTLGPDYRWRTSVYADKDVDASGNIAGDLVLYGRGAPDFSSEATKDAPDYLARLADELYKRGVRRVQGNLVGDESYFRGEALGDGWLWNDVQWYFGAEVSALTINGNETTVTITPGKPDERAAVKVEKDNGYFQLINDANTSARGSAFTIGVTRGLSDNNLRVWGDFPPTARSYSIRISVHKPALWAALLFREELKARGISVDGEVKSRDARSFPDERFDTGRAVELVSVTSRTLAEIVRDTNKHSINLNAELILRTVGRERREAAPDPDPVRMRVRGDDAAGLSFMRQWLEHNSIQTSGLSLHDGSGLSRLAIVTPEATARLHAVMAANRYAKVFRDSLPVAGRDGTLSRRLASTGGRIQAKTGTLSDNNSLSGYVETADGETFAFAIICNDETARGNSIGVIDSIAKLLADYRESR